MRAVFSLDDASAGAVVAALAGAVELRDLSVQEPDIEDVVARLYGVAAPSDRLVAD